MRSDECVEIVYDFSVDDLVELNRFFSCEVTNRRQRWINRLWGAGCIFALGFGLLIASLDWEYEREKSAIVAAVSAPLILTAVAAPVAYLVYSETMPGIRRRVLRQLSAAGSHNACRLLGRKRLVVDGRGFRVFGDGMEEYREWRILPRILRGFTHLYFCEEVNRTRMAATVVPGRGFPSQAAFDEYCALVEQLWRSANVESALAERQNPPADAGGFYPDESRNQLTPSDNRPS